MFDGTIAGDVTGIIFYLLFQFSGIWMMNRILAGERFSVVFRCLIGSVAGTLGFQWFPILFAFLLDFSILAHLSGLFLWLLLCVVVWARTKEAKKPWKEMTYLNRREWLRLLKENPCIVLMIVTFFFFLYCLITHTIPLNSDGSMHTGQATGGDMNMHLGFITSIANQKNFPPDYSIFPGARLSYPFLCDSISSSIYIWGASLQTAYIFPMLIAICQVMGGFYCLIKYWFGRSSTAFIAWIMFFLDGGLGFIYFTDMQSLVRNFNDFYYTPTSLGDMNIRWAQIIANMLIPQRATLFGWAILFPLLAFFLYAVRKRSRLCFIIAGIFAGALPMIHTHSFLAFGLVCTMWLLFDCKKLCGKENGKKYWLAGVFPLMLLLFSLLQKMNGEEAVVSEKGLLFMGAGVALLLVYLFVYLFRVLFGKQKKTLLMTWGIFLAFVILLALPQLLIWTFGQAGSEGFVRGHFNWSNTGDQYIWFYLKNIGLTFALFVPAFFLAKKKDLQVASPLLLIWFVAELVVFQPNEYDNNKLLFVGFVFMCGLAANFVVELFLKRWPKILKVTAAALMIFFGTVSAVLTLGREYVSDYELYSSHNVEACRFIEESTDTTAVFLTASNHNNAVASLTGRNIVCGSSSFLYYHGIDYLGREGELAQMYEKPVENYHLYQQYKVDYVYISGQEWGSYNVDMNGIMQIATCIYSNDGVMIFRVHG